MLHHSIKWIGLFAVTAIGTTGVCALGDEAMPPEGDDASTYWQAPPLEAERQNPVRANGDSIRRGARLFVGHCTTCHGDTGRGDGPQAQTLQPAPANLWETSSLHSDGDIAWKIANGRGAMPAWHNQLKDRQIWDVVNYLRYLTGHERQDLPAVEPR